MPTDAELLRQYARDRSEPAFAELVRRHIDLVYSAAVRRTGGDPHRAQEVTQDVFVALARRAPALTDHPALGAWLYASVRNAALNQLRMERRRRVREQAAHVMNESEPPAPDRAWAELRPVLDEAMDELAESDRRAIVLRFFEDRSYAELGAALALREEAARMRVARAVEKLRQRLSQRGITSTAAALSGILATHGVFSAPPGLSAAVAGAATAAAPAVSALWLKLLEFMTTTKAAFAFGGAAILILAGSAVRNTLAAEKLQGDLVLAKAGNQQAAVELQAVRRAAAVPAANPAPAAPSSADSAGAPPEAAARSAAIANAETLMSAHPELRRAWAERRLSTTATGVINLLRGSSVILNPEQQRELLRAADAMNAFSIPYNIGGKIYNFVAEPRTKDPGAVVALVGGEQVYQELMRTSDPRNIGADFSAAALEQDAPLTGDQVQQVTRILAQNSGDYDQGKSASVGTINWDAALAQAKGVLSPPQVAMLEGERQQVEFNVALRAARNASQAP